MTNASGEAPKAPVKISMEKKRIEQQIRGYLDKNFRIEKLRECHTALNKYIGEPKSVYDPYSAYKHEFYDIKTLILLVD